MSPADSLEDFLKEAWHKSKHYLLISSELVGWCGGLTRWQEETIYY